MSLVGMVTPPGRSFFSSGEALGLVPGLGDAAGEGDSSGDALGDAVALGLGLGVGLGEAFFFFFFPAPGLAANGELFGVALGEAFGVGDGDGFGVCEGDAFAFGDGEGEGVVFFFVALDVLRFFFFGAGEGSKRRLILSPNDSSACVSCTMELRKKGSATNTATTPARVIRSQRRRRGTSQRLLGLPSAEDDPSTLCEVPRRASPASG